MQYETTPEMRTRVVDEPVGVLLVIPARPQWTAVVVQALWLILWAFGEILVLRRVIGGIDSHSVDLFSATWLAVWTVAGLSVLHSLAWMLAGEERVHVTQGAISIKRDLVGLGKTQAYDLSRVRNLRIAPAPEGDRWMPGRGWIRRSLGVGAIAFDYGAKTVRFGDAIEAPEARRLIEIIRERAPIEPTGRRSV